MDHPLEFCYICFEQEAQLTDLLTAERESLELLGKLKICVSEVQWNTYEKLLICDKCAEKLVRAHEFKKQCLASSQTLKVYLLELENLKKANILAATPKITNHIEQNASAQQVAIAKIILHNQAVNPFQNVFLNFLPQNLIAKNSKNDCVIALPQIIQFTQPKITEPEQDVTKLLNGENSEELSVEIDPLDYNTTSQDGENDENDLEEKIDFFNSGHFLLQDIELNRYYCDKCAIRFKCTISLHKHIKSVHSNKYPYRCEHCGMEFASKDIYKGHLNRQHNETSDLMNDSITLNDFTTNSQKVLDLVNQIPIHEPPIDGEINGEYKCEDCDRMFSSSQGLIRHKTKVHHKPYKKKTYFVKGMKTAKCDICNRMFSTQSYMQLHRKLHDRKGVWRRKIFKQEDVMSKEEQQLMEDGEMFDEDGVDEEEDEINCRLNNVSEFLETSLRESTKREHDNG